MKRMTRKQRELIEVIQNFNASKGRMRYEQDFVFYAHQLSDEPLYPDQG